jgi:ferredoxin
MKKPVCISSKGMMVCPSNASITRIEDLNHIDLESVSFFVIDMSDWQVGYQQLQSIRSFTKKKLYLKPVLFQGISEDIPREVINAADGIVKPGEGDLEQEYNNWSTRFENINRGIDTLEEISEKGDTNIAFKVLRFIFTRGHEFKPIQSARNTRGYIYPLLEPLFPKQDQGVQETLEYLADQKLISGQYVCRAYNCTHCGCAFINFYETCPECASSLLRTEELIHHFKCAYIGEMSDYM